MGLFDAITGVFKGEGGSEADFDWNTIESTEQVDDILVSSNAVVQVIFKHSPRCATSFFARNDVEKFPEEKKENLDFNFIDVIRYRDISKYISERFGIRHESPQLFVLKDGEVVWHGSHHKVQSDNILKAIKDL